MYVFDAPDAERAWQRARTQGGLAARETIDAGLALLRSRVLTQTGEGDVSDDQMIVAAVRQVSGADSAEARYADGLFRLAHDDLDASIRLIQERAADWGPYDPRTLELGGLASVRFYATFPEDYRVPIARGLAAAPGLGPTHELTLLTARDTQALQARSREFSSLLQDRIRVLVADQAPPPEALMAAPLPSGAGHPSALTVAEIAACLPARLDVDGTEQSVPWPIRQYVQRSLDLLGLPLEVVGPSLRLHWVVDEHLVELGVSLSRAGRWEASYELITVEEYLDRIHLDSKAGEASTVVYLWCFEPIDGQQAPDGWESLGAFDEAETCDEMRAILELSSSRLATDIRALPTRWNQSCEISWDGPLNARLIIRPAEGRLDVDGREELVIVQPTDVDVATLVERLVDVLAEAGEPGDFERLVRFACARWVQFSTG